MTEKQTLGYMYVYSGVDIVKSFKTLELPFKGNQSRISCINEGRYHCVLLDNSPSFNYPHYLLQNVDGRDMIKIHAANYTSQLLGCIALGYSFSDINKDGLLDITNSRASMAEFVGLCRQSFNLTISNIWQ